MANSNCDIRFTGVDMHKGEYWYRCDFCGQTDWCARGDSFSNNDPFPNCKGKDKMTQEQFSKAVEALFLEASEAICSEWMNTEWCDAKEYRESEYFDKEENAEFLEAFEALGDVTIKVVDNFGGEGSGDDYYCVYEFSDGINKAYLKFDGWYASHYGSEFQSVFLVEPRQRMITEYV